MYTNNEQTAKLIELGFKPPMWRVARKFDDQPPRKIITSFGELRTASYEDVYAYSIGELIEMLPQYLDYKGNVADISIDYYALTIRQNVVMYCDPYMDWVEIQCNDHKELIDNLYDMILELKEEGVI